MTHAPETHVPELRPVAERTEIPGGVLAAAILLVTVGVLDMLQGISAVGADQLYVVGVEYLYRFDTTAWGWIHIVVGIVLVLTGIGLMSGTAAARIAAMVIAALSIIANFMSLPYYPAWSILVIVLDVVVIWAVATWYAQASR
ncbi:hypothetical protein BJY24_006686 [Nocardia transvalensis]|uniref:DUF7144 domain-containing protein n=1 Tax=Nocardia transvalensis TaxID=37333 RepID=A0A7W9PLD9_9NOCA|nr:hypothetical protein [Nocardia transvalensis]MBB5917774.1 hypothetical protein [Nocardia transvalensis]